VHRLIEVWAAGEASAALGFEAARVFDQLDPLERDVVRDRRTMRSAKTEALEYLRAPAGRSASPLVRYALLDAVANVLCPACKLWNTGHGARMMRETASLMGRYGSTEDCLGLLGHKWMH